jgi:hypothetical protein
MKIVLAILLIPLSSWAASLTGGLTDVTGAYVTNAPVELNSGIKQYHTRTSEIGIYQFSNLSAGEYTLTFRVIGFLPLIVTRIVVTEREQKQIPDVPLEVAHGLCPRPIAREQVLLAPGSPFGKLSGSVVPPMADIEVTLVCRTFSACRATKTDSSGRFSFDMLSPGVYGLNFRRDGFYPENASEYSYHVNAGWESVYEPKLLEQCPNGSCDPKLRAQRPVHICE